MDTGECLRNLETSDGNMDVEKEEGLLNIDGELYQQEKVDNLMTELEDGFLNKNYTLLPYPCRYIIYTLLFVVCTLLVVGTVLCGVSLPLDLTPGWVIFVALGLFMHICIMEPIKIFIIIIHSSVKHIFL